MCCHNIKGNNDEKSHREKRTFETLIFVTKYLIILGFYSKFYVKLKVLRGKNLKSFLKLKKNYSK